MSITLHYGSYDLTQTHDHNLQRLIVSGKENDFKNAFDKATKYLNSGKVFEHLTKLQSN